MAPRTGGSPGTDLRPSDRGSVRAWAAVAPHPVLQGGEVAQKRSAERRCRPRGAQGSAGRRAAQEARGTTWDDRRTGVRWHPESVASPGDMGQVHFAIGSVGVVIIPLRRRIVS